MRPAVDRDSGIRRAQYDPGSEGQLCSALSDLLSSAIRARVKQGSHLAELQCRALASCGELPQTVTRDNSRKALHVTRDNSRQVGTTRRNS